MHDTFCQCLPTFGWLVSKRKQVCTWATFHAKTLYSSGLWKKTSRRRKWKYLENRNLKAAPAFKKLCKFIVFKINCVRFDFNKISNEQAEVCFCCLWAKILNGSHDFIITLSNGVEEVARSLYFANKTFFFLSWDLCKFFLY